MNSKSSIVGKTLLKDRSVGHNKLHILYDTHIVSGNLVFESPVYFNQSLRILSYLNGIDPARWEAIAVTANNSLRQIISGSWSILGNVYFENGAFGSDILNGTNITDASITLATGHLEMDDVLTEKRVRQWTATKFRILSPNMTPLSVLLVCRRIWKARAMI